MIRASRHSRSESAGKPRDRMDRIRIRREFYLFSPLRDDSAAQASVLRMRIFKLALLAIFAAGLLMLPVRAHAWGFAGGGDRDFSGPYFESDGRDWSRESAFIDPANPSFESEQPGAPACPPASASCHTPSAAPAAPANRIESNF